MAMGNKAPRSNFGWEGDSSYGRGPNYGYADMRSVICDQNPLAPANIARTQAIVEQFNAEQACTDRREMLLDPNRCSRTDIERYDLSVNQSIVLGTAATINMFTQPAVTIRPQRCTFNAPSAAFVTVSSILVGNVNALVGSSTDAWIYSPQAFGNHLDLPTLQPANKLTVTGNYTGLTPPGFPVALPFPFVCTFQGPARVAT